MEDRLTLKAHFTPAKFSLAMLHPLAVFNEYLNEALIECEDFDSEMESPKFRALMMPWGDARSKTTKELMARAVTKAFPGGIPQPVAGDFY